jgi:hypothetical protein
MANYINMPAKVTECYECGEKRLCEIVRADHPDAETGYIDEYALCEECKNGVSR